MVFCIRDRRENPFERNEQKIEAYSPTSLVKMNYNIKIYCEDMPIKLYLSFEICRDDYVAFNI